MRSRLVYSGFAGSTIGIKCDGKFLLLTKILAAIPRNFRLNSMSRPLWGNATYINQENVGEKNCEVPLMRMIYQKATEVQI